MKTISVVVNARIGSTRVKRKLLRSFSNTNLLNIALKKVNKLNFFDNRFLAASDTEILKLADNYPNIKTIIRDKKATKTGVNPHEVTFAHYSLIPTDYIFVFNPCLPFITTNTIKMAFDYFQNTNFTSYTSVIETNDWIFDNEGRALTNTNPNNLTTNKNETFRKASHAFHIIKKSYFVKTKQHWDFTPNNPHLISMPKNESVDIDTMEDFNYSQYLYNEKNRNE